MSDEITVEFIENILDGKSPEEWTEFATEHFTLEMIQSTLVGFPRLAEAYLEAERQRINLDLANEALLRTVRKLRRKNRELEDKNG